MLVRGHAAFRDFQELLDEDLFVDYFNKFLCLPKLNKEGIYRYLWRRKFQDFVKTRFYVEYLMAKEMLLADTVAVSHFEFKKSNIRLSHRLVLENAVCWLKERCLGRVSAVKKFRDFLYEIPLAFQFFQYWIDIECMYRRILHQPEMFLSEFEELRMKYFYSNGILAFPQHLLDAAHEILERELLASVGSRIYDVCFAFCLQRLCLERLTDYWLIHYLIITEVSVDNYMERMDYNLALHFLRGKNCEELADLIQAYTDAPLEEEDQAFNFDVRRRSSTLSESHRCNTPIPERLKVVDDSFRRLSIVTRPRGDPVDHQDHVVSDTDDLASMKPTKATRVTIVDENTTPLDQLMERYNKKREVRRLVEPGYEELSTKPSGEATLPVEGSSDWHLYLPMIREIREAEDRATGMEDSEKRNRTSSPVHKPKTHKFEDLGIDNLILGASAHNFMRLYEKKIRLTSKFRSQNESLVRSKNTVVWKNKDDLVQDDGNANVVIKTRSEAKAMKTSQIAVQRSEMIRETNQRRQELIERYMAERNIILKSNKLTRMSYSLAVGVTLGSSVHDLNQQQHPKCITITRNPVSVAKSKIIAIQMRKEEKKLGRKKQAKPKPKPKPVPYSRLEPGKVRMEIKKCDSEESDCYDSDEDKGYRDDVENKRVIAALQTDEVASHPFENFLIDFCAEDEALILFRFWRDVEQLRYQYRFCIQSYPFYLATMRAIALRYLNPTSMKQIKALQYPIELGEKILSMKRFRLPKDLIKLQMDALDYLKPYFYAYWQQEMQIFYLKAVDVAQEYEDEQHRADEMFPQLKYRKCSSVTALNSKMSGAKHGTGTEDGDDGVKLPKIAGADGKGKRKKKKAKKAKKSGNNSEGKNKESKVKESKSEIAESITQPPSKMDKKLDKLRRQSMEVGKKESSTSLVDPKKSFLSLGADVGRERDLPLVEVKQLPNPKADPKIPSFMLVMNQQLSPIYTAQDISRLANFSGNVIDPAHPSQADNNKKKRKDDEEKGTQFVFVGGVEPPSRSSRRSSKIAEKENPASQPESKENSLVEMSESDSSQKVKMNYFKRLPNGRVLKKILDMDEQKDLKEEHPPLFTVRSKPPLKLVQRRNIPAKFHKLPTFSPETLKRIAKPSKMELTTEEKKVLRRIDRAYELVLDSYFATSENTTMNRAKTGAKTGASKISDDEGLTPLPRVQDRLKLLPVTGKDMADLAQQAAHEYPKLDMQETKTEVTIQVTPSATTLPDTAIAEPQVETVKWSKVAMFIKGRRPFTRPTCFNDILHDDPHFQFFRRFLKSHHASEPLEFWKAVEKLKTTTKPTFKKQTILTIVRKYIEVPKGELYSALASIESSATTVLQEIRNCHTVTVGMLSAAQEAVEKSLREEWFVKYLKLFSEDFTTVSTVFEAVKDGSRKIRKKGSPICISKQATLVFRQFFRRATRFVVSMRNKQQSLEFRNFLREKAGENEEQFYETRCKSAWTGMTDMMSKPTNADDITQLKKTGDTPRDRDNVLAHEVKFKQRIIGGELVNYRLLPNDFDLWLEIDCYQRNSDIAIKDDSSIRWIMRKARLIYFNFLNSTVAPALRVNVPYALADKIRRSLNIGIIWRSIFHEATLHIFPILLHFWKEYRELKYSYRNIKSLYLTKKMKTKTRSKRITSGYALPIFSLTNLFNRKPMQEKERKKMISVDERVERRREELTHMRNKDIVRRFEYTFHDDDPETRINFSLSDGAVIVNTLLKRGSLKIEGEQRELSAGPVKDVKILPGTQTKKTGFDISDHEFNRKNPEEDPDAPVNDDEFMSRFTRIFRRDESAAIR